MEKSLKESGVRKCVEFWGTRAKGNDREGGDGRLKMGPHVGAPLRSLRMGLSLDRAKRAVANQRWC